MSDSLDVELKRTLGFFQIVVFGVTIMIPAVGLNYFPFTQEWSNGYTWVGYTISAFIMILTVMSYQRMLTAFPGAGSSYSYTCGGINGKVGFLVGWTLILDYILAPMFTLTILGMYIHAMIPSLSVKLIVFLCGSIVVLICILGIQISTTVVVGLGLYTVFFTIFFIVAGMNFEEHMTDGVLTMQTILDVSEINFKGTLAVASLGVLNMCFDGMSTLAEEAKISMKKFGWALMVAVIIQAVLVIGSVFVAQITIDYHTIPEELFDTATLYLLSVYSGEKVAYIMLAIGQVVTMSCLVAGFTAASRLLYCMGRDGVISRKFFGYLHPKFRTPVFTTLFIGILVVAGAMIFDAEIISSIVAFGMCVGLCMANISTFVYFWIKKKEHRIFRHLIFPLIATGAILYIMSNQSKLCLTVGGVWIVIGLVFEVIRYRSDKNFRECIDAGRLEV